MRLVNGQVGDKYPNGILGEIRLIIENQLGRRLNKYAVATKNCWFFKKSHVPIPSFCNSEYPPMYDF